MFNVSLSIAQRQSVESYLARRYGIALGSNANPVVTASPSNPPSASSSPTFSIGASPTSLPTATSSPLRCAVDASFAAGIPSGWTSSPASLVTNITTTPARGTGITVTDPLNTGSPFAYLLSGAVNEYTTLSVTVQSTDTQAAFSASVLFDGGDELPYNADAFVAVVSTQTVAGSSVCGVAYFEGDAMTLTCPAGSYISSIPFASYGSATYEYCGDGGFAAGTCHAPSSLDVVSAACMGLNSCSVAKLAAAFSASSFCTSNTAWLPTSLFAVAKCSYLSSKPVWNSSVASVGAYSQSGWASVNTQLSIPGTYTFIFGVRAVGRASPARASALAVDNVLLCLSNALPSVTPTLSPSPLPSIAT